MYLLDTNALIILLHDELADAGLRMETRQIMLTEDKLYLSWVSLWEMAIKMKLGKLAIEGTITEIVDACLEQGIEIIPVKVEHIDETLALPHFGQTRSVRAGSFQLTNSSSVWACFS